MVNVTQRSNSPRANALWMAFTGVALATAAQTTLPAEGMTGVKVAHRDLSLASRQPNQVLLARIAQSRDSGERGVRADGHASCDSRVMRSHARLIAAGGAAQS